MYFGKSIVKQHSGLHMIRGHFLLTNVTYLICIVEGRRSFLRSLTYVRIHLAKRVSFRDEGLVRNLPKYLTGKKNDQNNWA